MDDKLPPNTKTVKKEAPARASINDKQISQPSVHTECSKSTTGKAPKKRTLKRNVSAIVNVVNSQIPPKQVKQQTDENSKQESHPIDGHTKESALEKEFTENSIHELPTRPTAEPVTPPKSGKNVETCSLSELESPVASLIFSPSVPSGDNATTTSQDESASCVDDSENESTPSTRKSHDTSSVPNSQGESAVTDDFDSDYNKQKADTEMEDSDDCHERTNARLCVERDVSQGKFSSTFQ